MVAIATIAMPAQAQEAPVADGAERRPAREGGDTVAAEIVQPSPGADAAIAIDPGRSAENAVRQAEDAFGFSVGRESLGLYSSTNVRGFSPFAAGNVRIEGLYFDPFLTLIFRLRTSATCRRPATTACRSPNGR